MDVEDLDPEEYARREQFGRRVEAARSFNRRDDGRSWSRQDLAEALRERWPEMAAGATTLQRLESMTNPQRTDIDLAVWGARIAEVTGVPVAFMLGGWDAAAYVGDVDVDVLAQRVALLESRVNNHGTLLGELVGVVERGAGERSVAVRDAVTEIEELAARAASRQLGPQRGLRSVPPQDPPGEGRGG